MWFRRFFFKTVLPDAITSFKRFQFPMSFVLIATAMSIYRIYGDSPCFQTRNMIMTLYLSYPFFLSSALIFEKYRVSKLLANFVYMLFTAILIIYYFSLPEYFAGSDILKFVVLSFSSLLMPFYAAHIKEKNQSSYWSFSILLVSRILFAFAASFILFLGLVAAFSAIKSLFDVGFRLEKLIFSLFVMSAGTLFP